jgi:CelD/BcsL family acetyltransferase involved in cellulose biosynthesis
MRNLAIPFDRELVSTLAKTYGATAGVPAHVVFRAGGKLMETIGLFRGGPVRALQTPTANHIPYASAAAADRGLADLKNVQTTTFDGRPLPPIDLLHLRGVPQSIVQSGHLGGSSFLSAIRNRRYILQLSGPHDRAFDHAPSGDGRRFRALTRSFGARFREVPPRQRIEAVGQICDMFAARALARGIAGSQKLHADRLAAMGLASHSSARVFVIDSDAQFIAGVFGLVAGDTFFALVSSGVAEGLIGRRSPGRLIKLVALEAMRQDGISAIDFGLAPNPEKIMICNVVEPVFDIFVPFSLAGRAAARAARAARIVRSHLRDSEMLKRLRS